MPDRVCSLFLMMLTLDFDVCATNVHGLCVINTFSQWLWCAFYTSSRFAYFSPGYNEERLIPRLYSILLYSAKFLLPSLGNYRFLAECGRLASSANNTGQGKLDSEKRKIRRCDHAFSELEIYWNMIKVEYETCDGSKKKFLWSSQVRPQLQILDRRNL